MLSLPSVTVQSLEEYVPALRLLSDYPKLAERLKIEVCIQCNRYVLAEYGLLLCQSCNCYCYTISFIVSGKELSL